MPDYDNHSSAGQEFDGTEPLVPDKLPDPDADAAVSQQAETAHEPAQPGDAELGRLRELLFSREITLIEQLREVAENPRLSASQVSEVLAEAIQIRSAKDPLLAMTLEPVVDDIVKASFKRRRTEFVNALSPLMGPSIRRSIAESFSSMMGNFSKSLEMAFSWKGLRWRLEAIRSGKPFSEIVMLHTLVYRVEQLFLIHNKTGLVLSHLAGESVEAQDPDIVSAMLTAIQDFVRDCFAGGREGDLHSLKMGAFTIYIESGPHAHLACVMRGTPPGDFLEHLRATLELVHLEFNDALETFNGDTQPFLGAEQHLESCLWSRYAGDAKKLSWLGKTIAVATVLAVIAGCGYLLYSRHQSAAEQARLTAQRETFMSEMRLAVQHLRDEPGLMIASVAETPRAPWQIHILQDAYSRPPEEVLREKGIHPALFSIQVTPFVSYDPSIVVRRVEHSFNPPDTVAMHFENGVLAFTGTAPMSWIVATREDARAIPGVERVDMSGVRDPMMDQISTMIAAVENAVIEFPLGRDTPNPASLPRLQQAIDTLVNLEKITKQMGFTASLTIYGHADSVGDAKRNYDISQARARTVASMLYARGSSMPVAIYGMGAEHPRGGRQPSNQEHQASRRIELRVHFALSPSASPELFRR